MLAVWLSGWTPADLENMRGSAMVLRAHAEAARKRIQEPAGNQCDAGAMAVAPAALERTENKSRTK